MKKLTFKRSTQSCDKGREVYHVYKNSGSRSHWVFGHIVRHDRHKSWYFHDWGETNWSFQHMKEITDFMETL